MIKPTLLRHPDEHTNLTAVFLEPLWREYFNIEIIDPAKTYNPTECLLFTNLWNKDSWYRPWTDRGFKLIVDHLWESYLDETSTVNHNVLTLRSLHWIWYNEALWYQHLGYKDLQLTHCPDHFFLSLMWRKRVGRDQLMARITEYLDQSLYSYVNNNVLLDNDVRPGTPNFGRYINPEWYQRTNFSLVAETYTEPRPFISEKTFKPMAFRHPFIIWGSPGLLKYVQDWGFETFGHVIDESYDLEPHAPTRLNMIIQQVDQLYTEYQQDQPLFQDAVSQQKLQHNFNHFYNQKLITNMFKQEIVDTIMDFVQKA